MTDHLKELSALGVSIWLDDLNRPLITGGGLQELISTSSVVGVTTNPSIFAAALSQGDAYSDQIKELASEGRTVDEAVFALTTEDVRNACDILLPAYRTSDGRDGRVSIEVDPRLAHDTVKTVEQAKQLRAAVDRPNVHIKIPATVEGLPAITAVIGQGISVNVTLIFSLERYAAVLDAYQSGLEQASAAGRDLAGISSVASFFISRVDAAVDKQLDEIGSPEAAELRGTIAIANARLAYRLYEETTAADRWQALASAGAKPQRPLWASTGVKDAAYSDTRYVDELVAPGVVNTMPGTTLEAVADHGDVRGDTVTGGYAEADRQVAALATVGVDLAEVTASLEAQGVTKFEKSWDELLATVSAGLARSAVSDRSQEISQ